MVNPLTALDYAASGLVVRRFSIAVPFTVSLIRPLHRPSSALVQAFSEHLQAGLPKLVTSLDAICRQLRQHKSDSILGMDRRSIKHRQNTALFWHQ
ncbi:LysR family transcriptional regulator [Escherichia coli]|uniref:LysR family transcriptional regulator n=1 Tax=Escherichia coli TaxID=562 RepID=A0A376NVQ8_ECOLX|nr:LysR family transcriptional regulator [Escherichia coli]